MSLKSQIVTSSWSGRRKPPRAFTEQGVAMLSGVLNSDQAILVNIEIMRVFVKIREMVLANRSLQNRLDRLEKKYDKQFKVVFDAIRSIMAPEKPSKKIGFQTDDSK